MVTRISRVLSSRLKNPENFFTIGFINFAAFLYFTVVLIENKLRMKTNSHFCSSPLQYFLSRLRNCIAADMCSFSIFSLPFKSAIVLATLSILS